MKKMPGDIILLCASYVHHKWRLYNTWFLKYKVQQTNFFVILGHFLLFHPSDNSENQNSEKLKKSRKILSFYTCVLQMTITWCMVHETWNATDIFLSFWTMLPYFGPCLEISSFYTKVPKIMIRWYMVPGGQ